MPAKTAGNFTSDWARSYTMETLIAQSSPLASVTSLAHTKRVFQKQTKSTDETGPPFSSPGRRIIFTEYKLHISGVTLKLYCSMLMLLTHSCYKYIKDNKQKCRKGHELTRQACIRHLWCSHFQNILFSLASVAHFIVSSP